MNLRVLEFYLLNIKAVYLISLTSQDENFLVSIEYIEERGAVATATGGGRSPSTGVRGCNPLPRSAQQGAGRMPKPHEVRRGGSNSSPACGGHLKEVSKWAVVPVKSPCLVLCRCLVFWLCGAVPVYLPVPPYKHRSRGVGFLLSKKT
jgi:hypothetical protein